MVYSDNAFNSDKGKELLKDIFNLMFVSPLNRPNDVESNNKIRQTTHYKNNIVNIVNKMRKFVKGYQQVIISEADSSGIHVCPHCKRRDAIWMWETVDAGHYASANDWLSSVALRKWNAGYATQKGRYQFVVRYRCNDVTTCNKCHLSVAGHQSSCKSCGSSDVVNVGCGEESYATHFIREYTADDNHPQTKGEGQGAVARNITWKVRKPGSSPQEVKGRITGYEFKHNPVKDGEIIKSWSQIKDHLPYVNFTYTHTGTNTTKERQYPVSELNYAISKQKKVYCNMGKDTPEGGKVHPGKIQALATSANGPLNPMECPWTGSYRNKYKVCKATDFGPLYEMENTYYAPKPMKIMNPQPLEASTSQGGTFMRKPVYTLYLESPVSDSFKLLLPLPQVMTLNPIPNEPFVSSSNSSTKTCPNDVGAEALESTVLEDANEKMQEKIEKMIEDATNVGDDITDADAQTNKGYTFDVCEGRSRKAYYEMKDAQWIDDSPPCKSFRKDGATLTKSREYARWSEIPSYSPLAPPNTFFTNYLGPNPKTHLIQDWIKANQALNVFGITAPKYHIVQKIAETIEEDVGLIYNVFECLTCKAIVEDGGIIQYRQSLGQCDKDGKTQGKIPQEVIDAEVQFQNSYPLVNTKGDPVATAWGIIAHSEHNGKEMLLNPDLNIRIG